jgi:hypothetical protein
MASPAGVRCIAPELADRLPVPLGLLRGLGQSEEPIDAPQTHQAGHRHWMDAPGQCLLVEGALRNEKTVTWRDRTRASNLRRSSISIIVLSVHGSPWESRNSGPSFQTFALRRQTFHTGSGMWTILGPGSQCSIRWDASLQPWSWARNCFAVTSIASPGRHPDRPSTSRRSLSSGDAFRTCASASSLVTDLATLAWEGTTSLATGLTRITPSQHE